jgi:hypothetical protein
VHLSGAEIFLCATDNRACYRLNWVNEALTPKSGTIEARCCQFGICQYEADQIFAFGGC